MEGNYSPRERTTERQGERRSENRDEGTRMSVPLAPRRLAERKYYFYAALSSLLPPQGLFLPLPLAPTLSPPYPPFLAPFSTYNAAVPFSQAPQALPTAANWKSPSRVACALLRASGRVGRCAARAACNPPSQRAFVWPGFIKTNRFYSADAAR